MKISEDTFRMILKGVDFKGVNFFDLRFVFLAAAKKGVWKQKGTGWGRSFPLALSVAMFNFLSALEMHLKNYTPWLRKLIGGGALPQSF